jgi:hypothetical protein
MGPAESAKIIGFAWERFWMTRTQIVQYLFVEAPKDLRTLSGMP